MCRDPQWRRQWRTYLLASAMKMQRKKNGIRSPGQRTRTAIRMKQIGIIRWRKELIITHLYGIMPHLSRINNRSPGSPGSSLHASWHTIRGTPAMETAMENQSRVRGYRYTCSRFQLHGSCITANGGWSRPPMESSRTSDPEYIYIALLEVF